VFRRFLLPAPLVSVYYLAKYGCRISPRAKVEVSRNVTIGRGSQISSFVKIKATYGPLRIGVRLAIATGVFIDPRRKGGLCQQEGGGQRQKSYAGGGRQIDHPVRQDGRRHECQAARMMTKQYRA
jgi:hypothetical protein